MIARAAEVTVIGCPFLLAVGRADRAIHVEDQLVGGSALANPVHPLTGHRHKRIEVVRVAQHVCLNVGYLAPNTVEAIVTDDRAKRMLRVHLLGYNAPLQTTPPKDRPHILPSLIEDAPIYRAIVELAEPIKRATASNKSTKLTRRGRRLEVMVNDIHEIVIISY